MTPDEYCQDKAVKSGSSFYYSFLFLPPERRRAITALYAYCREVDDVADSQGDRNVARRKLDWWAQEVGALFDGAPTHPVTRALQPFLAPYDLRRRQLVEVMEVVVPARVDECGASIATRIFSYFWSLVRRRAGRLLRVKII